MVYWARAMHSTSMESPIGSAETSTQVLAGLLLRWIGTNMLAPPEPLIRQLYRLADGSLEGIVQRFLATADDKADC